mgnify:CR=1 FL=1
MGVGVGAITTVVVPSAFFGQFSIGYEERCTRGPVRLSLEPDLLLSLD